MANFAKEHSWIVSPFSGNEATHLPPIAPPPPPRPLADEEKEEGLERAADIEPSREQDEVKWDG